MSGNPFLGLIGHGEQRLQVIETERGAIAPHSGLILERPREGRGEERSPLAGVLPDRRFDVPTSQLVGRLFGLLFLGRHLVSSLV